MRYQRIPLMSHGTQRSELCCEAAAGWMMYPLRHDRKGVNEMGGGGGNAGIHDGQ